VAIASARQAYQIYKEIFKGQRFQTLAEQGARPQRVLWASTGTKNPEYSDIKYVEALIGSETVNTLPQDTLAAYRDHGEPAPRLETELDKAAEVFRRLGELNIDIDEKTQQLENEGIRKFNEPFDSLMATLESKRRKAA
jgi:transaldolase